MFEMKLPCGRYHVANLRRPYICSPGLLEDSLRAAITLRPAQHRHRGLHAVQLKPQSQWTHLIIVESLIIQIHGSCKKKKKKEVFGLYKNCLLEFSLHRLFITSFFRRCSVDDLGGEIVATIS